MVITSLRVQYVFYGHWAGVSWVISLILGGGVVGSLFHTMHAVTGSLPYTFLYAEVLARTKIFEYVKKM